MDKFLSWERFAGTQQPWKTGYARFNKFKNKIFGRVSADKKLQCLYLYYNRSLSDISALEGVKDSLKALRIENCAKIKDFSVLEKLENLELLDLSGSNEIPSLSFIRKLKNLKMFVFSVNVLDGDLTPCKDLSYAACVRGRKHYNMKDRDLPKGKVTRGNEDIELWRRFE